MGTNELKKWIIDHNVEVEILKHFDESFSDYKINCLEEFNCHFPCFKQSDLSKYLYKVSLTLIGWGESEQECIIVFLRIKYKDDYAGEYKLVYSFEGDIINDYLIIE